MTLEGNIDPDHSPKNRYKLQVIGLPDLLFTKVDGLEEELETVTLPDRSMASGGNSKAVEFTAEMPLHHTTMITAMKLWWFEGKGNVTPTYKKNGTMIYKKISGGDADVVALTELFITKRKFPDGEMANEGEDNKMVYTFSAQIPI